MPVSQNTQHTKIKTISIITRRQFQHGWSNNFGVINKAQMLANLRTELKLARQ